MQREFLQALDLGDGAKLPEAAVAAILAEADREAQEGKVRFTARMAGENGASMTREQIMAIPDRKRRRTAIANNLNLFKKEN